MAIFDGLVPEQQFVLKTFLCAELQFEMLIFNLPQWWQSKFCLTPNTLGHKIKLTLKQFAGIQNYATANAAKIWSSAVCTNCTIFFIFIVSKVNSKNVNYRILPMTGFELQTSGIRRKLSANWATTTAHIEQELLLRRSN